MGKRFLRGYFAFLVGFLLLLTFHLSPALAIPTVSIGDYEVVVGETFTVDVLISGIEATQPLNAFEFDIDYDPAILTAISIADAGFLPSPLGLPPLVVESDINPPDVNYALATIGWGGGVGSGTLAAIVFQGIALGTSGLDLNDVILSAPGGVQITPISIEDGSASVVPEPATLFLLSSGLLSLAGLGRKRFRNRQY